MKSSLIEKLEFEYNEVNLKCNKLYIFLLKNKKNKQIIGRKLLIKQYKYMNKYRNILSKRIDIFKSYEK
jgi:hypothetical protein